jgi:hypothetical protein
MCNFANLKLDLVGLFQAVPEAIQVALNSNFVTALAGAGLGAWAGAYAAQRIADQQKNEEALITEIRSANAANRLSYAICNHFIAIKKQHVKTMLETFNAKKVEFEEVQKQQGPGRQFELTADFETLPQLVLPIVPLQELVYDKLSLTGRAILLAPTLAQVIDSTNEFLRVRTLLIEEFRKVPNKTSAEIIRFYFGLRDAVGNVDRRYESALRGLADHIDQGIFFSKALAEDLRDHVIVLRSKLGKKALRRAPEAMSAKFNVDEGLIPPDKEFETWVAMKSKTNKESDKST